MGTQLVVEGEAVAVVGKNGAGKSTLMQGLMGNYLEQSKNLFVQMQEQMQKQSEQMLAALGLKR